MSSLGVNGAYALLNRALITGVRGTNWNGGMHLLTFNNTQRAALIRRAPGRVVTLTRKYNYAYLPFCYLITPWQFALLFQTCLQH